MCRFLYCITFTIFAAIDDGLLANAPTLAKFGLLNREEQILEISGSREISGVYPHLTTYSQSLKDGRFFKQGLVDQLGGEVG